MSDARHGRLRVACVSVACLLRQLPLFFTRTPRTPLRVLGIVALETLHVLRTSRPLPRRRVDALALFLDFEGCANAAWDDKALCQARYLALRHRLEQAGFGPCVDAYLQRLRDLERRRPPAGGDRRRFDEVRAYREAVARLSLASAAAIAFDAPRAVACLSAVQSDADVETLFRILMQCQIIDDVIDYAEDATAGLPSFLTASASLRQALDLTARSAVEYGRPGSTRSDSGVFPHRLALRAFTAMTRIVVRAGPRFGRFSALPHHTVPGR